MAHYPDGDDVDKTLWQSVLRVGVPAALLIFLVIWLVGDFNVRLKAIEDRQGTMQSLLHQMHQTDTRALRVLQVMCLNMAETGEARRQCLDGWQ